MQAEDNVVELRRDREAPVNPPSFDEFFLARHDRLYRALYFVTGSREDAEELMQDAFVKRERWDTIHGIDDPVAWLFRVSLNGFRMRRRRAAVAARRLMPIPIPSKRPSRRELIASKRASNPAGQRVEPGPVFQVRCTEDTCAAGSRTATTL